MYAYRSPYRILATVPQDNQAVEERAVVEAIRQGKRVDGCSWDDEGSDLNAYHYTSSSKTPRRYDELSEANRKIEELEERVRLMEIAKTMRDNRVARVAHAHDDHLSRENRKLRKQVADLEWAASNQDQTALIRERGKVAELAGQVERYKLMYELAIKALKQKHTP